MQGGWDDQRFSRRNRCHDMKKPYFRHGIGDRKSKKVWFIFVVIVALKSQEEKICIWCNREVLEWLAFQFQIFQKFWLEHFRRAIRRHNLQLEKIAKVSIPVCSRFFLNTHSFACGVRHLGQLAFAYSWSTLSDSWSIRTHRHCSSSIVDMPLDSDDQIGIGGDHHPIR